MARGKLSPHATKPNPLTPIWLEPLTIERLTIEIPNLPSSLEGKKIVQLTDLHYDGKRLSNELLEETITASNRENPDLVVLTGDYVTDDPSPVHQLATYLKELNSHHGTVAVLGNHDNYFLDSREMITNALQRVDIEILWNTITYPFGPKLPIVGLADLWSGEFSPRPLLEQLDPDLPRIVLSHNPDTAALLKPWRVDLQLSGHTHGGQVVLPKLGSFPVLLEPLRKNTPKLLHPYIPLLRDCARVVKHWEWGKGYHHVGENQLYVNRGLGTYFPGRLNCPPELTVITLVQDN